MGEENKPATAPAVPAVPQINYEENYRLLVKAAANGGNNALSKRVNELIVAEQASVKTAAELNGKSLTNIEILNQARQNVVAAMSDPAKIDTAKSEGKDEKAGGFSFMMELFDNPLAALAKRFGQQIFGAVKEKFGDKSEESFMAIFERKGKEADMERLARSQGVDSARLLAELKSLPADTATYAQITPVQQAERLAALEKARIEKAQAEAKEAEQREVERAQRLAQAQGRATGGTTVRTNTPPAITPKAKPEQVAAAPPR